MLAQVAGEYIYIYMLAQEAGEREAGGASASSSLTHYSHSLTHSPTTLLITQHLTYSPWQVNARRPIYGQRGRFTERFRKKNWLAFSGAS